MKRIKRPKSWIAPVLFAVIAIGSDLVFNLLALVPGVGETVAQYSGLVLWLAGLLAVASFLWIIFNPGDSDYPPESEPPPDVGNRYLEYVRDQLPYLPLAGLNPLNTNSDSDDGARLDLPQVYVGLNTRSPRRRPDDAQPDAHALAPRGKDSEEPLPALQAVVQTPRLVLTGRPGGGKSTLLRFIGHYLARAQLERTYNAAAYLVGWSDNELERLPVPISLRNLAVWYQKKETPPDPGPVLLYAYIEHWLTQIGVSGAFKTIQDALENGHALLLLDGLDEVDNLETVLTPIKQTIEALSHTWLHTPIVVTCRVQSYADSAWKLREPPWVVHELAPFDDEQIDSFIDDWHKQLGQFQDLGKDAQDLHSKLTGALARDPDLRQLAEEPLLLTIIALVNTFTEEGLPDTRAELYEAAINLLLFHWDGAKRDRARGAQEENTQTLEDLLYEAGRHRTDLKPVLYALAYEAHAGLQASHAAEQDTPTSAQITQATLEEKLKALHPQQSVDWARRVIGRIHLRVGLLSLVPQTPDIFTFPHPTFQEFLAGCYLAHRDDYTKELLELANQGIYWRKVLLLAAGYTRHVQHRPEIPLVQAGELCPQAAPHADDEAAWRNVWLAGEFLKEVGLNSVRRFDVGRVVLERTRTRLAELVDQGRLTPRARVEAGSVLAELGDPRDLETMIPIPAGPFRMGSNEQDPHAFSDEKEQAEFYVDAFRIAQYPVTNEQYARFVAATEHPAPGHWIESARGMVPPPHLRNHPVTRVSWHDAQAYCAWLSQQRGECVRLPTEAEWEKAARGTDGRLWPWGSEDPDADRCNYAGNIGATSPVGSFPRGASPYGMRDRADYVLDMAGNVWEWTGTLWDAPEFPYCYAQDKDEDEDEDEDKKGNEKEDAEPRSVLRGGSWGHLPHLVRCAFRVRIGPLYGNLVVGFRVVSPGCCASDL